MKRYVLPSLKMLIVIALTKIAFFPGDDKGPAADIQPGVSAATQTSTAVIGDIANTVSVKGQVVEDAAVNAPATLGGVVDSFAVEKNQWVESGAPLLYIKRTEAGEPVTRTDAEGNTTQEQGSPKVTWATVYAPASGVRLLQRHQGAGDDRGHDGRHDRPAHLLGQGDDHRGAAVPVGERPDLGLPVHRGRPRALHLQRADHRHEGAVDDDHLRRRLHLHHHR